MRKYNIQAPTFLNCESSENKFELYRFHPYSSNWEVADTKYLFVNDLSP